MSIFCCFSQSLANLEKVASSSELLWLGRPPDVSQLGDSDKATANAVRERQADTYHLLEALVLEMQTLIEQCSGISPAGRHQLCSV